MKIISLVLEMFSKLQVSRIKRLSINVESDTQVIIGSNGSGKSSLIHELYPYPSIKTTYGRDGSKELTLLHNGSIYKITYYVETKQHHFIKDGINLNTNGTNEIQRELIAEHLGLDSTKHQIMKCSLPICTLTPSQRKKILMELNPINISLFINRYKKVHKETIAYSNNLDRLYERQKTLMDQQLPKQQYDDMLKTKARLENQEKLLLMWITKTGSTLEQFIVTDNVSGISSIDTVLDRVKSLYRRLNRYRDIPRKDFVQRLASLPVKIDMTEKEIAELDGPLENVIKELDNYERKLASLDDDSEDTGKELAELTKIVDSFEYDVDFICLSKTEIEEAPFYIDKIKDELVNITYIEFDTILSREEYDKLSRTLLGCGDELKSLKMELCTYIQRASDAKKLINEYTTANNCSPNDCELFQKYNSHVTAKKAEYDKCINEKDLLTKKVEQLTTKCGNLSKDNDIQKSIWQHIDTVLRLLSRTNIGRYLDLTDISSTITQSPLSVANLITEYVNKSNSYIEHHVRLARLEILKKDNEVRESKMRFSADVLNGEIAKYKLLLDNTRNKRNAKIAELSIILKDTQHLKDFSNDKDLAKQLLADVESFEDYTNIKASREYLDKVYRILNSMLNSIRNELIEISKISNEQESLIGRLDKEVNSIIIDLKSKYDTSMKIESALFELPINYTKSFVNKLIETANYFIAEVMTYPMSILPIDDKRQMDFYLPIIVEDVILKDVSMCSDGQKTIIQLAWNLALIIELGLNDYPIYIDEITRSLDGAHSSNVVDLLTSLIDQGVTSQIFMVNHDNNVIDGMDASIIVLNSDNVVLPTTYNDNVEIEYL